MADRELEELTLKDVEAEGFEVRDGTIVTQGKYEAEPWWAPLLYRMIQEAWGSEPVVGEDGWTWDVLEVGPTAGDELARNWGLEKETSAVVMREDEQGFVRTREVSGEWLRERRRIMFEDVEGVFDDEEEG